jgi:hypothetical protein
MGRLLVRTSPAGARVLLDGKDVGLAPVTLRTVPFGGHTIRVSRDGYRTEERQVTLSTVQPAQSIEVDLARTDQGAEPAVFSAGLTIESRPPGAAVFLDGKPVGTTPLTMPRVVAGSHVVRIELEGYRMWSGSVRVAVGEGNRVTASLEQ